MLDHRRHPGAVDDDVEAERGDLAKCVVGACAGRHRVVRAERLGELQLLLLEIDDGDRARAAVSHELEHEQSDRPCAVDHRIRPNRDAETLEPVDDAGDRLDERRELQIHVADRIDVRRRSDDVLREAAVARHADRVPVEAVVPLGTLAEEALAAEE